MSSKNSFWSTQIIQWEKQRYQSLWAPFFYSSLKYRQQYAAFILNQIPDNSSVVEIGCGSGILYSFINPDKKIKYTGIDISAEAIRLAQKNYPNGEWLCKSVEQLHNINADYFISAGLLDWLGDDAIIQLLKKNKFKYHLHSFSLKKHSWKNYIHSVFSCFTSYIKKIAYQPRTFEKNQILKLINTDVKFIEHPKLSFGAFAHNLPVSFKTSFKDFLNYYYFNKKNNKSGFFEKIFKNKEHSIFKKNCPSVAKKNVLEIGSGHGAYTEWILSLHPAALTCLDPAVNTKKYVKNSNYEFVKTTLENFKSAGKYDIIVALGVAEFVSDLDLFIEKILSFAETKASLIMFIPNEGSVFYSFYRRFHGFNAIDLNSDIETKLTHALGKSAKRYEITKINGGFLNNLFIIKIDG